MNELQIIIKDVPESHRKQVQELSSRADEICFYFADPIKYLAAQEISTRSLLPVRKKIEAPKRKCGGCSRSK